MLMWLYVYLAVCKQCVRSGPCIVFYKDVQSLVGCGSEGI